MYNYKKLSIRGTLLEKYQLGKHIEKIANDHSIKINSDDNTFPIYELKNNFKFIFETYELLNSHIKMGIKIHSAGEWLLDNFYIIEENVKSIEKEMTKKKYKNLPGIANGNYSGFSRCYVLAEEIVAYTDCKIDKDIIDYALKSYQNKKLLSMEEIMSIGIFIKISLISHIADICEKIYLSQIQKYKVENIIERIIENKSNKDCKFTHRSDYKLINEYELKYPFIEYMSYRLKMYGKIAQDYQDIFEKEVQKTGVTVSDVIQKEHLYIASLKASIGNCITSIKSINRVNFSELFSYINASEEILKDDPASIYNLMDQESKIYYRNIIKKMSHKSKISEVYISEKIIDLCNRYVNSSNISDRKKSHVGYYLLDEGKKELEKVLELKQRNVKSIELKTRLYSASIILMPLYFDFVISVFLYFRKFSFTESLLLFILLYFPLSEIFIRIINYILGKVKKPIFIPKINYENKIPIEKSTFVVIPTILKTEEKVKEMIDKLEVYYLANKSDNLYFALLGDCSEEKTLKTDFDENIIECGKLCIKKLNEKYPNYNFNKFHFLYRKRVWNKSENSYIGWERKRGLLVTFNKYIKKIIKDDFLYNTIELQKDNLPDIKYIITLDSDTNLSLGSASKMIGAMSHILNEPIIKNKSVVERLWNYATKNRC